MTCHFFSCLPIFLLFYIFINILFNYRPVIFAESECRKNGAARQNFGAKTEKEREKEIANDNGEKS